MPVSETLLDKVKNYVRAGDEDDLLLVSLISAAKQYLSNAGIEEPSESNELENYGELSLYELAITLYINMIYDGGKETLLDRAMTGIILQIKNYNGV